ncbi:hypothetical protein [Glutamicibacter arilaitensis]|uniref:hypothetical protein n=1 Tax=Glutamicibacter arilaitensis TaxID=256701 RepID=UPI0021558C71|nr:hypothetical protein [Glutamicibacter arilaitensis]
MIGILNRLIEHIEAQLRAEINLADLVQGTSPSTPGSLSRLFLSRVQHAGAEVRSGSSGSVGEGRAH